ncbi:hypothetical protein Pla100_11050 [Neorhodopirellula pilleata]|uniref:Uncharacterized protein n=2 Tax=Neorhodopirellula pilleata TaxID=2714738 RepID=A0A5C6APE6_9BACT|nr:hypothetical protein Pla100_11050 [Neorhodopirellula pilleata]
MESESRQKSNDGRQISVAGMLAYTALWALIICLSREAVNLQQGIHSIAQARLSEILMLIVTGLLFVAIGLPIAIVVGRTPKAVPISLGCFLVGFIAIPVLVVVLVTLGSFGVIDLD